MVEIGASVIISILGVCLHESGRDEAECCRKVVSRRGCRCY